MSSDLGNINRQLTSGKTRKGRDLNTIPGKREKLEEEKAAILAKMQEAKDKRHDDRMTAIKEHTAEVGEKTIKDVNSHTTSETDRVIKAVASLVQVTTHNLIQARPECQPYWHPHRRQLACSTPSYVTKV